MSLIEKWLPRSQTFEEAVQIVTHETLHEATSEVENTTFTEALFDALCGRGEAGLWFAKGCFEKIKKFLKESS